MQKSSLLTLCITTASPPLVDRLVIASHVFLTNFRLVIQWELYQMAVVWMIQNLLQMNYLRTLVYMVVDYQLSQILSHSQYHMVCKPLRKQPFEGWQLLMFTSYEGNNCTVELELEETVKMCLSYRKLNPLKFRNFRELKSGSEPWTVYLHYDPLMHSTVGLCREEYLIL